MLLVNCFCKFKHYNRLKIILFVACIYRKTNADVYSCKHTLHC